MTTQPPGQGRLFETMPAAGVLPKLPGGGAACRLYVGDAARLDFLDAGTVDVIITSPPYNLGSQGWDWGAQQGRKNGRGRAAGIGYADDMPEADYQAWQAACLAAWWRVARPGASLFYNHKIRLKQGRAVLPSTWLTRSEWTLRQVIVWDRGSTHNHTAGYFWQHTERVYWLTKGKPTLPAAVQLPDVWRFPARRRTWHPAPFPPELVRRCLQAVGCAGMVVLDPFCGSGTTCAVASAMGYESIGVDCQAGYVERAAAEMPAARVEVYQAA